jgi:hypothetical protein
MLEIGLCGIKKCSTINLEAARKRKSLFFPIFAKDGGATNTAIHFFSLVIKKMAKQENIESYYFHRKE